MFRTLQMDMQVDNTVKVQVDNTVEVSASTATSPFMCHLCSKTFGQRRSLSRHFESHGNKSHECAECDHKFTSRYNLDRHIVMVHKPKDNIYCPHCGKEFKSACALAHHVSFQHNVLEHKWHMKGLVAVLAVTSTVLSTCISTVLSTCVCTVLSTCICTVLSTCISICKVQNINSTK